MKRVVLDIESVPKNDYVPAEYPEETPTKKDVPEHGSMKDPDKIIKWKANMYSKMQEEYDEKFQKFMTEDMETYKRQSLNFNTNQIVSISVQINNNPVQNFSGAEEGPILSVAGKKRHL